MTASRASPHQQRLRAIKGFRLITSDLPRLAAFYRDVLGFAVVGDIKPIGREEMGLLGLQGGGRRQDLSIGSQTVAIDEFEIEGRAYPPDTDAASPAGSNISPWSLSRSRKRMPDCATSPRSRSLGRSSCPPHLAAFRPSSFAILTGTLSNCCSFRKTIRRRHGRINFWRPARFRSASIIRRLASTTPNECRLL